MSSLTTEQQAIVSAINTNNLVKVEAVSGSGKTHTLVACAEAVNPERGLYLAYNKAIAIEASHKFPHYIDCRTIHSLAYQYIIASSDRTIEYFTPRCIVEKVPYQDKLAVVSAIEEFYLSQSLTPKTFLQPLYSTSIVELALVYINKMIANEIPVTFGFLLKFFHLQLASGSIVPNTYDLLMLDEAGDTSGVILEIFKLLPATKKIMVGDPQQNIYSFAYTINGFEALESEGISLPLSKSFRVSPRIASSVQSFCNKRLSKTMVFEGTEQSTDVKTQAYISRTNSGLIARAIELNKTGTVYSFTRDPKEIFSLVNTLMMLKVDSIVYDKRYAYLPSELRKYESSPTLQQDFSTFKAYLMATHAQDDIALRGAINLLFKYSYKVLFETYDKAKSMPKTSNIVLTTAHSSKGLEFDSVFIEDDLNKSCERAKLSRYNNTEELTEFRLYYVACTRARIQLHNAKELYDD